MTWGQWRHSFLKYLFKRFCRCRSCLDITWIKLVSPNFHESRNIFFFVCIIESDKQWDGLPPIPSAVKWCTVARLKVFDNIRNSANLTSLTMTIEFASTHSKVPTHKQTVQCLIIFPLARFSSTRLLVGNQSIVVKDCLRLSCLITFAFVTVDSTCIRKR